MKKKRKDRRLSKSLIKVLKEIPKKAHPMDVARTAVSVMGLEDKETSNNTPSSNMRKTTENILQKLQ